MFGFGAEGAAEGYEAIVVYFLYMVDDFKIAGHEFDDFIPVGGGQLVG